MDSATLAGADDNSWPEYWRNNASLYVMVFFVLGAILANYLVEWYWRRWQTRCEHATGIMKESQAFSSDLIAHFVTGAVSSRHQFRGMQGDREVIDVGFEDLHLEVGTGQRVLRGVTGAFHGPRVCAIMGPSGAGKTTFMNVLCGKATYGKMTGSITINGKKADIQSMKHVTGFVPQDDIVYEDLTVREQINFSARLRNPKTFSARRLRYITDDVLHVMQLEHVQNSVVGGVENRGISGGQRKRVNVGLELAAQPTLLFLDEPTSGLDSTSSLALAMSLKRMTRLGMSSIMVIHQPRYSLFTLFDDVLLLGKGGRTVYLGPACNLKRYFESIGFCMPRNENPADWFMDITCGEVRHPIQRDFQPEMLFDLWDTRRERQFDEEEFFADDELSVEQRNTMAGEIEYSILRDALEQEWDKIDINRDGTLQADEMQELLAECSTKIPDPEVVRDLMNRMAGADAVEVTKQQFLQYLCSLGQQIAHDMELDDLEAQASMPTRTSVHAMVAGAAARLSRKVRSRGRSRDQEHTESDSESSFDSESERSENDDPRARATMTVKSRTVRNLPGFGGQVVALIIRRMVQLWRMTKQRVIFIIALIFAAVLFGALYRYIAVAPLWDATPLLYLHTALALLLSIFSLHVFGGDRPVFWRERSRGVNVFAFFTARVVMNAFDLLALTFVFTCVYYIVRQPEVPYRAWMAPFVLTAIASSGWGYLISTLVEPKHGPFIVTLVIFVTNALLGDFGNLSIFLTGGTSEWVVSALSITRWTVGMSFCYEYTHLSPTPDPKGLKDMATLHMERDVYFKRDWGLGFWWTPVIAIALMTSALYSISFICLRFRYLDKQV